MKIDNELDRRIESLRQYTSSEEMAGSVLKTEKDNLKIFNKCSGSVMFYNVCSLLIFSWLCIWKMYLRAINLPVGCQNKTKNFRPFFANSIRKELTTRHPNIYFYFKFIYLMVGHLMPVSSSKNAHFQNKLYIKTRLVFEWFK